MGTVLPNLIIGPLVIVIGVLVIVFRRQVRDATVNAEKTAVGDRIGRAAGLLQTPFWVAAAGIIGVLVGILMLIGGVVTLVSHNT
ncbi:hypothetical protein [Leifsonia sp. RAF41]|uniref:hypothetical protein n=1 Tax=Leifsonia sp. RAF41 TaxID=3233056 RepID=UPI003F9BDB77